MARTSTWLISMYGMGLENKHLKQPSGSRRTPPIAVLLFVTFSEASMFHLSELRGGGDQFEEDEDEWRRCLLIRVGDHNKHWGFLTMSVDEYGNGSPQPIIHQLNLKRMRFCTCSTLHSTWLKHLTFLDERAMKWRLPLLEGKPNAVGKYPFHVP